MGAVKTGLDGRPQMIQAEMGSFLGLGTSTVLITPDELESRSDGLQLECLPSRFGRCFSNNGEGPVAGALSQSAA